LFRKGNSKVENHKKSKVSKKTQVNMQGVEILQLQQLQIACLGERLCSDSAQRPWTEPHHHLSTIAHNTSNGYET